MQAQAMVDTDSTRPWRDLLEGRLICLAALFHTTSHEHTILDMIQECRLWLRGTICMHPFLVRQRPASPSLPKGPYWCGGRRRNPDAS